ncbi:14547_t:CDS:2 [Funneliformis geosporum]|uniref:7933_t:CDS:1 n=1 Tax=Funneliformis geosporum TaxID=1117311 RepID=A0A9W4SYA4_9GLOM|nr:7933_t:CDS:2 [Funneliformis geosporum]CAI2186085.1 14547_t:CDS:2 [Funneliformis geosporum]
MDVNPFSDFCNFDFEEQDTKKTEKVTSQKNQVLQNENLEYIPKHDYDGWFHTTTTSFSILLRSKGGPTQIKQSIEHLYFHRRFEESLRLSLEYIKFIEQCNNLSDKKEIKIYNPNRLNNPREMLEIASRCALQLKNVKLAVKCIDKLASDLEKVSNEPGHMRLRGMIYATGGRYADSIHYYIKYLQIRNNDYKIWKEMSHTFLYCYYHFANPKEDFTTDLMKITTQGIFQSTLITKLALICIKRAYELMLITPWATSVNYINSRFTHEKREIEYLSNYLEKVDDNFEESMSLLNNLEENETAKKMIAENGFDLEMIKWILVESKISVNGLYLMDQERLAKDL